MNNTLEKLTAAFSGDLTEYRSIPFWSWNSALDENELTRQIEEMKSVGIGGFIMHARTGLSDEYLGEKWFSCIGACLKKARELGMRAWVYDENGWPSGFVGGELLKNHDFLARFLEYEVKNSFDNEAYAVFTEDGGVFTRIDASISGICEYHCVYLKVSPANTDILNPAVVDAFIEMTHEQYYKRFPESFGRELVGFFTDEPQYYRWGVPFSHTAESVYKERYGEDIRDGLVYLFIDNVNGYEFRTRYFTILNELYVNSFYKKLYDWCTQHNCMLTGHSVEESSLRGQMMGGAAVMPTYEYEHIPGVDCLGRECKSELMSTQIGSVCAQLGIKQALTETFGCAGYDATPWELKSIAEAQYFGGVNLMCQHLYPYSIASLGKIDHPPVFSKHGNWFEGFGAFNEYFTRLGYIVSNTEDKYDALIIHPERDIYLDHTARCYDRPGNIATETAFRDLLQRLREHGVTYHFADETILKKYGKNEGGKLIIGNCAYDTVILPQTRTVAGSTLDLLESFGGRLHAIAKPTHVDGVPTEVTLSSNTTLEQIEASAQIRFTCADGRSGVTVRSGEIGDFLFIKNYSRTEPSTFTIEGAAQSYRALDLETMTLQNISDTITLRECGSLILIRDADACPVSKTESTRDITADFAVSDISENYLVLDMAKISYDGEDYSEVLPIPRHFEDLLRADYKGPLWVKHTFTARELMPLTLMLGKEKFNEVTLNGSPLTLKKSDFDINFAEADLTDAVRVGENEIVYSLNYYQHDGVTFALFDPMATESLRNCLYYDTNIDTIYIKGDFVADKNGVISRRTSLPTLSSELYKNGYPFFSGKLTLTGRYTFDGEGERTLCLDNGRFMMAAVYVNGERADIVLDTRRDITKMLRVGENEIKIVLYSSLRNLFGPHHYAPDAEPLAVGPGDFTMRGQWNGGTAPTYTSEYNSVPFGVDAITVIATK